jgi:MFS family permease
LIRRPAAGSTALVLALGSAQTLAWASTYYLPAILALPMARELGVAPATVFAAFSVALLISAALGPLAGRTIDRVGGRPVLMATSLCFAAGLALLGLASGPVGLFLAWAVLGIGMGSGLYEAAFATLVRLQGQQSRASITGITLLAGFASTVGWPLSAWLDAEFGWRTACFTWAALHLLVGLPLNALVPRLPPGRDTSRHAPHAAAAHPATPPHTPPPHTALPPALQRRALWLLGFVFAATWFTSTAMAAHLPALLQTTGVSMGTALMVGMLVGPAQVVARMLEFGLLRHVQPVASARLAASLHPLGVAVLAIAGPWAAPLFGLLHGAGNGVLTIAKGTLPLVYFGATGYGRLQGVLGVPTRVAQALAPWLFGLAMARWGSGAFMLTALLGVCACAALWALPSRPAPPGNTGNTGSTGSTG